jgi:tRNA(Ile2) C34 agmatinyltransferase TiaS
MYTIGTNIVTGDIVLRNMDNGTAVTIPKDGIAGVVEMLREKFPPCEACDGTMVDGYCSDCGEDFEGNHQFAPIDPPPETGD